MNIEKLMDNLITNFCDKNFEREEKDWNDFYSLGWGYFKTHYAELKMKNINFPEDHCLLNVHTYLQEVKEGSAHPLQFGFN